jgi:hypothetical protein
LEALDPKSALKLIPLELWAEVLALMLQLRPGLVPESFCQDYADAPTENLVSVFEAPLQKIRQLLLRTRSLLLVDWSFSREINEIVQKLRREPH